MSPQIHHWGDHCPVAVPGDQMHAAPAEADCDTCTPPVAVVDVESATRVGERVTVLARFENTWEAEAWIDQHPDQDKVERGGFGIDAPEEEPCCYPWYQTRQQHHAVDCPRYP